MQSRFSGRDDPNLRRGFAACLDFSVASLVKLGSAKIQTYRTCPAEAEKVSQLLNRPMNVLHGQQSNTTDLLSSEHSTSQRYTRVDLRTNLLEDRLSPTKTMSKGSRFCRGLPYGDSHSRRARCSSAPATVTTRACLQREGRKHSAGSNNGALAR